MVRPKDHGDQYPSDTGDTKPASPLDSLSEGDATPIANPKRIALRGDDEFIDTIETDPTFEDERFAWFGIVDEAINEFDADAPREYRCWRSDGEIVTVKVFEDFDQEIGQLNPIAIFTGNAPDEYFGVLVHNNSDGRAWWAKAQRNWKKAVDDGPGQEYSSVRVKLCKDVHGDGEFGEEFDVMLPVSRGEDPNVVKDQIIGITALQDGAWAAYGMGDDKIGTLKMWVGKQDDIPDGWEVHASFNDRFPKGITSGGAGTTGGASTHTHVVSGGSTTTGASSGQTGTSSGQTGTWIGTTSTATDGFIPAATEGNTGTWVGSTADSGQLQTNSFVTGLTVDNTYIGSTTTGTTQISIADHPDHHHKYKRTGTHVSVTQDNNGTWAAVDEVGTFCSTGVWDADCGTTITLSHNVTDNGHAHDVGTHGHTVTDPGHFHTIPGHAHDLGTHKHPIGTHTHPIGTHVHPIPSHAHDVGTHTHDIGTHTHTVPAHSHTTDAVSHEPLFVQVYFIERKDNSFVEA